MLLREPSFKSKPQAVPHLLPSESLASLDSIAPGQTGPRKSRNYENYGIFLIMGKQDFHHQPYAVDFASG